MQRDNEDQTPDQRLDYRMLVAAEEEPGNEIGDPDQKDCQRQGCHETGAAGRSPGAAYEERASLCHGAYALMAHRRRGRNVFEAAVWPEVGGADTSCAELDDSVGWFNDPRIPGVLHPDVTGA